MGILGTGNRLEIFLQQQLLINQIFLTLQNYVIYLRSSLKGDAENLVKSYSITEENFVLVWEKLKEKYEVKKRLAHAHISAIFSLKLLYKPKATDLKKILDGINTYFGS